MKSKIHYPVVIDEKSLGSLIMCGNAIIRNPKPERIKLWKEIISDIKAQARQEKGQR